MKVKLSMNPVSRVLQDKGISVDGNVQRFHTANVLRRIVKYMPYRTGATIKLAIAQTDIGKPFIVTDVPYGKYLYYGKAMEGPAPKVLTDRDLRYTTTKNPNAGPFWDRRLAAAEGSVIACELQNYVRRRR